MPRRRFTSEKNAEAFAEKVDGQVNDLREIENAKSKFTVTYKSTGKTKHYGQTDDWCPEEDRDFGYPNEYWN